MNFKVLTLFTKMYDSLNEGIIGAAQKKGLINVSVTDIRDFSKDKHRTVDDYPYGGGAGMLLKPEPVFDALNFVDPEHKCHRIFMSARGKTLNQKKVEELSLKNDLLIICGSYEGLDQRIIDNYVDEEISVGDYVLTSGDYPCMILINAVSRYVDGVLGSSESLNEESYSDYLLEYPQYTHPEVFNGFEVPEILLSGHHGKIAEWRKQQSIEITQKLRPDLYRKYYDLHKEEIEAEKFKEEKRLKRLASKKRKSE